VEAGGQQITTGLNGQYLLINLPAGEVTITIHRQSYLRTWKVVAILSGQTTILPDVTLLAGDINQDGVIELADLNLIGQAWNATSSSSNWNPAADITNNGIINILDMVAVSFNWDWVAPGPW